MNTFINEIPIFSLQFMAGIALPVLFRGDQFIAIGALDGKSFKYKEKKPGQDKIGPHEFELKGGSELIKFRGTGQNNI